MKIQKFNGGLSTRLAPQFIESSDSIVNINVDTSVGHLESVRGNSVTGIDSSRYFTYFREEDKFISSDSPSDYLEFQGFLYSCDGVNRPTKTRGNVTQFVGIERPSVIPTITNESKISKLRSVSVNSATGSFAIGPDNEVTGDLPSVLLKYLIFIRKDDKLSAGYRVDLEPTSLGTKPKFVRRYPRAYDELETDLFVGSVNNTSRIVIIENFDLDDGEEVVVYRQHENEWKLLGTTPNNDDRIFDTTYTVIGSVLDKEDITPFSGEYQYVYTYYNILDGTESAPSDITDLLEVDSGYIRVQFTDTPTDPQITHRRLYRVGGNIGVFSLVEEIDISINDYDDRKTDIAIDGRTLTSENYFEAPEGLKFITESYSMLFGAVGNELRFTPIAEPNAWPIEFSLEFDDNITGIGTTSNGLLVMTADRTHIVTGTGPFQLSTQPLRGDQGCISHKSVQQVELGAVVWASSDGLCVSSGNNPKNITKYKLGDLKFNPVSSCVHNEVYYLLNNDGIIFVWDYRFEPVFKQLDLGIDFINEADGKLYGHTNGKLVELLSGDKLSMSFTSGDFIEGSYTEIKMYNKFNVYYEGNITITLKLDGNPVLTKDLEGSGFKEFKVPQDCQRAHYFSYEVQGTGILKELEYVAGRRKND